MPTPVSARAANPFDQFDPPAAANPYDHLDRSAAATAAPTPEDARARLGQAMRAASAAPPQPGPNPFDQFDAPAHAAPSASNPYEHLDMPAHAAPAAAPRAAAPEQPSTALDVAKAAGSGLIRGVVGAATAPVTLANAGADALVHGGDYLARKILGLPDRTTADAARVTGAQAEAAKEFPGLRALSPPPAADLAQRANDATRAATYDPQTTAGRLAEGVAEFAPSALVGSGGIVRRGLEAAGAGLASEGAGEAAHAVAPAAEPYARLAGGLIGGGGSMVTGRYLAPTVDEMIARAARGVTPEQFTAAAATKDASAGRGMFLSGPEAVQAATLGSTKLGDVQRAVEASTGGGPTLAALYAQRPAEVRAAVGQELDRIAPASANPSAIGPRAQAAAQGALDDVRQGINAATRPAYAAAEAQAVPAAVAAANAADPAFRASLARLRNDPVLGPTYHAAPDDSVAVVDAVTKDMRDRGMALGNAANPGFNSQLSGLYGSGAADARNAARSAVPEYDDALTRQEELRRTQLDPLQRGPLGRVAGTADGSATTPLTQRVGDTLLPRDPLAGSQDEVADAFARLHARDPGVADDVLRQHLADKLDASAMDLAGGPNQSVGPKFRNLVAGSPQQRDNLSAALGGPQRAQGLSEVLDLLQAQSYRRPAGSNTAMDTATRALMAEPGGATKLGFAMLNPYAAIHHGFGDLARRHALDRSTASLASLFAAPDSVARIQAMAASHGHSLAADMLTRGALQEPAEARSR